MIRKFIERRNDKGFTDLIKQYESDEQVAKALQEVKYSFGFCGLKVVELKDGRRLVITGPPASEKCACFIRDFKISNKKLNC